MDTRILAYTHTQEQIESAMRRYRPYPTAHKPCADCGRVGQVYDDDHETMLCGRCWLVRHGQEARA